MASAFLAVGGENPNLDFSAEGESPAEVAEMGGYEDDADEGTPAEAAATGEVASEKPDPVLEEPGDVDAGEAQRRETVLERPACEHVTFDANVVCGGYERCVRDGLTAG